MDSRVKKLVSQMTTTEKAILCVGRDFWYTRGIKRLGLEPYMVTDGPHGLRKQSQSSDNLGINDSVKATCFPPACTMASTWNETLLYGVGKRMGEEAKDERVSIILGPGANIKRSPLCGRNFEYYSEDPFLAGKCAKNLINGIQSNKIGTSLKHFAVNNQEADRLRIDAVLDERTLREIYLKGFEIAVKESKPTTIMCSYNKVNGRHASINGHLLNEILRDEWGFDGYVMTDWGAVDGIAEGIKNGLDLEMPGGSQSVKRIVEAVENGTLPMDVLDRTVERLVDFNLKASAVRDFKYVYDRDEHHAYVRAVADEGAVLLKNEKSSLPLSKDEEFLVFGGLFKLPRYQGSGSSLIKPNKLSGIPEAFEAEGIKNYIYSEGFSAVSDVVDDKVLEEALSVAKNSKAKKAVVFSGLTMFYESEGFDRSHMQLPPNQNKLIERLCELGKDVIVVLFGGSPVEMPWINKVAALLNMYLPGQAIGESTVDLLFGKVNPSGKLAETYPICLEDVPSTKYFPEGPETVEYREGLFVGYRYFNKANKNVLFPFGFGLSYTKFEYSELRIRDEKDAFIATFKVKNVGKVKGKEVAEVYIEAPEASQVIRTAPELKGFEKVELEPGEEKTLSIKVKKEELRYFNTAENAWATEDGIYKLLVGASSMDIRLSDNILIYSGENHVNPYQSPIFDEYKKFTGAASDEAFKALIGRDLPPKNRDESVVTMSSTINEIGISSFGKIFRYCVLKAVSMGGKKGDDNAKMTAFFMKKMMEGMTLSSIANTNGGILPPSSVDGLILAINHHFFKGIFMTVKELLKHLKYDKELKKQEILERKVK